MHTLKIMVGSVAALLVGAASAQMSDPWQVGEAWGGFVSQGETQGAQGRAYSDGGMPAEPAKLTITNEAYDGGEFHDTSAATGAMGRPFGEPGLTRDDGVPTIDFSQSSQASELFLGD